MHRQTQGRNLALKFGLVDSLPDFELNNFADQVNYLFVITWNYDIVRTSTSLHRSCIKTDTTVFSSVKMLP